MKRGFLSGSPSKPKSPDSKNDATLSSTVTHEGSCDDADADPDYPKMIAKLQWTNYDMTGPDGRPHICEFHIVGTAHVSKESCRDVEKVIRRVQPDVVMLELCKGRQALLSPQTKARVPTMAEMLEDFKSGRTPLFGIVYSWMLAKFADHLEVMPGEEFRVGFKEAQAIGAKVVLGDRHVNITLKRTWAALSTWQRIKFIWCLIYSGIAVPDADELEQLLKDLKETDMLTEAIKELSKEFPSLAEPLIYERDRYMVHCLRSLSMRGAERVVAVVGAGHMPGMRENWEKEIDMEEITRIPEAPPKPTYISWPTLVLLTTASSAAAVMYLRTRRR